MKNARCNRIRVLPRDLCMKLVNKYRRQIVANKRNKLHTALAVPDPAWTAEYDRMSHFSGCICRWRLQRLQQTIKSSSHSCYESPGRTHADYRMLHSFEHLSSPDQTNDIVFPITKACLPLHARAEGNRKCCFKWMTSIMRDQINIGILDVSK